jgi:hypothetical protein
MRGSDEMLRQVCTSTKTLFSARPILYALRLAIPYTITRTFFFFGSFPRMFVTQKTLNSLSSEEGLHQLLPYFSHYIAKEVRGIKKTARLRRPLQNLFTHMCGCAVRVCR